MTETNSTTTTMSELPENFTPRTNQLAVVFDGFGTYYGSFTGRRYVDGGWQVFYKDICGDNCWANSNQIKVTLS
jgi:hypothetical protein